MRTTLNLTLLLALGASPLAGQLSPSAAGFGASCASASSGADALCFRMAEAARMLGPRAGIVLTAGSPVPGTASTLGLRTPGRPRISAAARLSAAGVELPDLEQGSGGGQPDFTASALALDLSIGVFSGLTLASTIGGFGSLDLLAGAGALFLPGGDGFAGPVGSWSAGARLGLLRESFTAPGVSVSAAYRGLGAITYGDPDLAETAAWFRLADVSVWSLRASAGKRLLGLGLAAGAGRDFNSARATGRVLDTSAAGGRFQLAEQEIDAGRNTIFASAAYTRLVLQAVAELGWQTGGSAEAGIPTTGRLEDGAFYGSLAFRFTF